jgi:hypothetical protein
MMQQTGMLAEGMIDDGEDTKSLLMVVDGIHVDMNHLKKGEVK